MKKLYCEQTITDTSNISNIALALSSNLKNYKSVKLTGNSLLNTKKDFYKEIAETLGRLAPMEEDLTSGNKNGEIWTEIKYDPEVCNSFRHSNTHQPLHTDGSYESNAPEITFFFCKNPAEIGGATIFIDSIKLGNILKNFSPNLFSRLTKNNVVFQKGNDKKECPILRVENGEILVCWNYYRAVECADLNLFDDFKTFLDTYIFQAGICKSVNLAKGEAIFFHDNLLLHGRNSFLGNRHLIKGGIWL